MYSYKQGIPKKGKFICTRFLLKSDIAGKRWQVILTYALQIFIGVPIALIIDILTALIKLISKAVKSILLETKKLTLKLAYELLKALLKPFAILLSIFAFSVIIYSLIKDITVFQTVNIIMSKLF